MADPVRASSSEQAERQRARDSTGTLLRIGWMLVGNLVVLLLAALIALEQSWTITVKDGLFWLAAASLVLLRYVDITKFDGQTAYGERATRRHFVRYAAGVLTGSAGLWTIVQCIDIA